MHSPNAMSFILIRQGAPRYRNYLPVFAGLRSGDEEQKQINAEYMDC